MSKTVISVENLTKRYDLGVIGTGTISRDLNRWWAHLRQQPDPYTKIGQEDKLKRCGESILALDDVSFTVQQGETLGIIGKNGAGKSTLLKILSRVTAPTSGVVKIQGRIGSLLEVGTGFHPELTGRENVFLNGAILGMRKEEVQRKFDEIVDFSGVEKFIDTPVKRYSSGMYVRLAFAVAAHLDPEILVVDEVLAVGDAEFQKKCLGKMGEVAEEGRTVLFVSHNMASINSLCGRGLLLIEGKLFLDSTINEVIDKYLTRNEKQIESHYEFDSTIHEMNNGFFFDSICILQPNTDKLLSQVSLLDGFDVLIKYKILKPIEGMNVSLHLTDSSGTPILTSSDIDSDQSKIAESRDKGSYDTRIHINNNYLREGSYIIGVSASIPHRKVLGDFRRLFSINVIDTGSYEGLVRQNREGIINPIIPWITRKCIE
jgi:lipopolysaccharide transport system ATP-binding protein